MRKTYANVYTGLTSKFAMDTYIYSVFVTTTGISCTKIPAMTLMSANGVKCYRLNAPYFIDPLCSTDLLVEKYLNRFLQLKSGRVSYFINKTDALNVAKQVKQERLAEMSAEVTKLREGLETLRSIQISFD